MLIGTVLEGMLVLPTLELSPRCGLIFGVEGDTGEALRWLTDDVNAICLCPQSTCHSQAPLGMESLKIQTLPGDQRLKPFLLQGKALLILPF